jgi:hypothetical protein
MLEVRGDGKLPLVDLERPQLRSRKKGNAFTRAVELPERATEWDTPALRQLRIEESGIEPVADEEIADQPRARRLAPSLLGTERGHDLVTPLRDGNRIRLRAVRRSPRQEDCDLQQASSLGPSPQDAEVFRHALHRARRARLAGRRPHAHSGVRGGTGSTQHTDGSHPCQCTGHLSLLRSPGTGGAPGFRSRVVHLRRAEWALAAVASHHEHLAAGQQCRRIAIARRGPGVGDAPRLPARHRIPGTMRAAASPSRAAPPASSGGEIVEGQERVVFSGAPLELWAWRTEHAPPHSASVKHQVASSPGQIAGAPPTWARRHRRKRHHRCRSPPSRRWSARNRLQSSFRDSSHQTRKAAALDPNRIPLNGGCWVEYPNEGCWRVREERLGLQ